MAKCISSIVRKARKDYRDDSAEFIIDLLPNIRSSGSLTFPELRSIARLKANNWKIKKGQLYERQYNEMDGETYTFRSLPDIVKICLKHKLYPED